jgi:thiol-disulfide isomerase/thioredoxin
MRGIFMSMLFLLAAIPVSGQKETIRTLDFGEFEHYLKKQTDSVYVINFWATWCGPCREEMPDLEQISRDYATQKVQVLFVSLDMPTMIDNNLIPYIKNNDITAPVVLLDDPDANAWIDKVDPSWSGALPATLVYTKNKRIFFGRKVTYQIIDDTLSDLLIQ